MAASAASLGRAAGRSCRAGMAPRHHQAAARAIRRSSDGVRDELGLKAMTIVQVDATTRLEKTGSEWCEQSGDSGLSSHRHSRWPDELHTCARPDGADHPTQEGKHRVLTLFRSSSEGRSTSGAFAKPKAWTGVLRYSGWVGLSHMGQKRLVNSH